jgi:hypothetical protein
MTFSIDKSFKIPSIKISSKNSNFSKISIKVERRDCQRYVYINLSLFDEAMLTTTSKLSGDLETRNLLEDMNLDLHLFINL